MAIGGDIVPETMTGCDISARETLTYGGEEMLLGKGMGRGAVSFTLIAIGPPCMPPLVAAKCPGSFDIPSIRSDS
jgi:hypothetical protein